ncbi:MAG: bifunctional DNA primase/polymerase [Bryobacteraceae bacterium]|nr:bifunctional DNA primase/polymerase [Bryobacteraceae bacterium]
MARNKKELMTKPHLDYALEYIRRGWHIFPIYHVRDDGSCSCGSRDCKRIGKHPVPRNGFNEATIDEAKIRAWWAQDPNYNIGFCPSISGLVGTDIDCGINKKTGLPKVGRQTWDSLLADPSHQLPPALSVLTGGGGEHVYLKATRDIQKSEGRVGKDIDVRGVGGYLILPPSNHESGKSYTFKDGDRWPQAADKLGDLPEWLATLMDKPATPSRMVTGRAAAPSPGTSDRSTIADTPHDRLTLAQVQELLKAIPPDQRDTWMKFGFVMKTIAPWIGGESKAFDVWDEWAEKGEGYGGLKDQQRQWESFTTPTEHPIELLKQHARDNGWAPSAEFQKQDRATHIDAARRLLDELTETATSDDLRPLLAIVATLPQIDQDPFLKDIKRKTANRFGIGAMRDEMTAFQRASSPDQCDYGVIVAHQVLKQHFGNGKLLIRSIDKTFWRYNGWYWEPVKNDDEIRKLCVEQTLALGPLDATVNSVSQQALDLLEATQALPGDPLRLTQPPPPVINCKNGELWIKDDFTLELRLHQPESYLRYGININYDPEAQCPMFDQALRDIFQDAGTKETRPKAVEEMCRHMEEIIGYTIQPRRHYKLYLIFYGRGNNGKSKLVELITALVTEDCVHAGRIGKLENSEYLIAHLCNKLLFVDDDVDSNTVLPDGILKKISEAKLIQGRDPYGKPREFKVSVVPMLLANNYPYSKDLSRGTQIRAHVVPFTHEFKDGVDLNRKLFEQIISTELAGVLNRAIEGLKRLEARGGFKEPADCLKAKAEFMASANPLVAFIEQQCETVEQAREAIEGGLLLNLQLAKDGRLDERHKRDLRERAQVDLAKLEKDGIEQHVQEFYTRFKAWCETEGINWKPRKSDVERDLVHSGFYVGPGAGQKVVRGLRAKEPPM